MKKTNQLPLSVRKTSPSTKTPTKKINHLGPILHINSEPKIGTENLLRNDNIENNNNINLNMIRTSSNLEQREGMKDAPLHIDFKENDLKDLSDLMKQLNDNSSPPTTNIPSNITPPTSKNPKSKTSSSEKKVSLAKLLGKSKTITTSPKSSQLSPETNKEELKIKTPNNEDPALSNIESSSNSSPPSPPLSLLPPKQLIIPPISIPDSIYSQPLERIEIDHRTESPPPLPPDSPMSFGLPSPISFPLNPFISSPIISPRTSHILSGIHSPIRSKTPKRNLVELSIGELTKSVTKIQKINTLFDQNNDDSYEWSSLCSQIGANNSSLKEIVLKKCSLDDDQHFLTFFESLIENDVHLQVLDIEGNKMRPEACSYLGEYLFMSRDTLKVLNLRNNPLTDEGVWNIVQSYKEVSEKIDYISQLTEIDISGAQVSDEGLLCLALFAKDYLPNLSSLKCFGNCITNINVIKDLVKDSGKLRHVDFWKNSIQVESLARLASSSTNLISLNLGCNFLGDKGVVVISKYLSIAKNLRCLDLSGNEIRDAGGFHLANAILVNCGLTLLNLANNLLTENSVSRIIDCIKNHPTLCNLSITRNRINPVRVQDLNRYISDVNAVRKRLGYPVCKSFISTSIDLPTSSPRKSLNQNQTTSSNDSFDEELTLSISHNTHTPRAFTPNFEIEPILSPSLNLSPSCSSELPVDRINPKTETNPFQIIP